MKTGIIGSGIVGRVLASAFMYKPKFPEGKSSMFICGYDEGAKKTVSNILTTFGFETEDMGKVESARAIVPLCILWCISQSHQKSMVLCV